MSSGATVVSLGHAIVDVLAQTDDSTVSALGLDKGTMVLVDGERAAELYAAIQPDTHASGGSAANTAACVASLGGDVRFEGKVADDELGRVFADDIRGVGVVYETPPGKTGTPGTGRCLVLVTPDAEKTMCTNLGAGATLDPSDLHPDAIAAAGVLYMEGYLCGPPDTTKTVYEAMAVARRNKTLVAFSASDPGWVALQRAALVEVLDQVDLLFANEPEALGLSARGDLDGAVDWLLERCPTVAVTLGADGCLVARRDRSRTRVPAVPVEHVVDSTGAGDSFAAGFLFGLVNELGDETSARLGALAAGEIVSHMGARPLVQLDGLARQAGLS
jgi:sugar/nucleoside kinase (ribokinase family)